MDTVLIYGDGFLLSIKEPDGWNCVCDGRASRYGVNAALFPSATQSRAHHLEIKLRVNGKSDENTQQDLTSDMRQYKQKYPNAQFDALDVTHAEYKTYSKLFLFPNDYYEYVAYMNPGATKQFTVSIWMSKEKTAATPEELSAYRQVLQSLHVF